MKARPAAPLPSTVAPPREARRGARDDRFQRALDEQAHDDAEVPEPRRVAGRDRKLGERREPRPVSSPEPGGVPPPPADDPQLALRRWLAPLSVGPGAEVAAVTPAEGGASALVAVASLDAAAAEVGVDEAAAVDPGEAASAAFVAEATAALDGDLAAVGRAPRAPSRVPETIDAPASVAPEPSARDVTVAVAPAPSTAAIELPPAADPREPASADAPPPAPAPTDRARLVLEHGGERVVVSVAVRHGAVSVAIDAASATLGEAVGATRDRLDAALQSHGMHLADLTHHAPRERSPSAPPSSPPRRRAAADPVDDDPHPSCDPRLRALA